MDVPNTVDAFKWTFRDTALWAVRQYSPAGGIDAVRQVLEELDILNMPVGPGVKFRNSYDLEWLPSDTIVTQGEPENIPHYNVWVLRNRRRVHLLGGGRASDRRYLIAEMPEVTEPPAWLNVKTSAMQTSLLGEWKRECWDVAYRAKMRHSWCGDFETVMFSMGVCGDG